MNYNNNHCYKFGRNIVILSLESTSIDLLKRKAELSTCNGLQETDKIIIVLLVFDQQVCFIRFNKCILLLSGCCLSNILGHKNLVELKSFFLF